MTKKEKNNISVIAQAFYGNRTRTSVCLENIDDLILGFMDEMLKIDEKIDRTVMPLPGTNCVLIYNKFQEEKMLQYKDEAFEKDGYILKSVAYIPEQGIELYSRCIVCGLTDDGALTDVPFDEHKIFDYLAM